MSLSKSDKVIEISYKRIFREDLVFASIALRDKGKFYGGVAAAENMKLEDGKLTPLDKKKQDENVAFEQGGLAVLIFLLPWEREDYDRMAAEYFSSHPKAREVKWTYNMEIDVLGKPSHEDFD